jgi:hypothetical protein
MKSFIYNNETYVRAIPGKNLFKSTMVHEVVNRGDIFAIRVKDSILTIIPGDAEVSHHCECDVFIKYLDKDTDSTPKTK